jgi:oligoendopeptidase F
VYTKLLEGVRRNLPTFHRYLKLRKRIMDLPELHYYDLYAPLVKSVDTEYSIEDAEKNILAALAPLGKEYAAGARQAFSDRWIDFYPLEGKAAGGYMSGDAYDVHPYILLNFNGKYEDMNWVTACKATFPIRLSPTPWPCTQTSWPKLPPRSTRHY